MKENQPNINPQLSEYISHVKKAEKIKEKNADTMLAPIVTSDRIIIRQLTPEENSSIKSLAETTKHDLTYLTKLAEFYPKTSIDAIEETVISAKKFRKTGTIQNYQQISGEKRRIERALDLYEEYHIPPETTELIYTINRTYEGFTINGLAQLWHQLTDGKEVNAEGTNEELVELIEYLETNAHQENIFSDVLLKNVVRSLKENPGLTGEQLGEMALENLDHFSWLNNPYAYACNGEEAKKACALIKNGEEKDPIEDIIDAL